MLSRIREKWAWPGAVTMGLALAYAATLEVDRLSEGGLAPIAVAVVVAVFLGLPLATTEWRVGASGRLSGPAARGAQALVELWSLLLVAAIAAPWVREAGGRGLIVAAGLWIGAGLAVRLSGGLVVPLVAAAVCVGALGSAVAMGGEAPPWTLLEPHWSTWRDWLPSATAGGFLLSAAGWGQWSGVPGPAPGRGQVPWAVAGMVLLASVAVALRHAVWFEQHAGGGVFDPVARMVLVGAAVAAGSAVLCREGVRGAEIWHAIGGLLATLWFAGPAYEALSLWWGSLLPLGPALFAVLLALRAEG
ncbi:MAG: hypothetical protein JRI25_23555, partial [Deltaproteobacteria bacterium]|nr:hypothetical protein [Deltaproteobacteria bacterium]